MNLIELHRALRQLRLGGIAAVLETRLQQAQTELMAPIDFLSCLVSDELRRRGDRLLERRRKQAQFRDPQGTLDNCDWVNTAANSMRVRDEKESANCLTGVAGRHRVSTNFACLWPVSSADKSLL